MGDSRLLGPAHKTQSSFAQLNVNSLGRYLITKNESTRLIFFSLNKNVFKPNIATFKLNC